MSIVTPVVTIASWGTVYYLMAGEMDSLRATISRTEQRNAQSDTINQQLQQQLQQQLDSRHKKVETVIDRVSNKIN